MKLEEKRRQKVLTNVQFEQADIFNLDLCLGIIRPYFRLLCPRTSSAAGRSFEKVEKIFEARRHNDSN